MQPLIGREQYLGQLDELLRGAVGGTGGIALVIAEGGGGKTALLDQFVASAPERATVAWGDCLDGEGTPPLWPWTQVLRAVSALPGREPLAKAALAALSASAAEADRFQAFEAVSEALAARVGPLVVVLDDVHWADGATLRLLEFVAPLIRRAPVLLIVAARPTGSSELDATLGALQRRGAVRLALRPLSVDEVREQLTATGADPAAASEVASVSGGNPLFVTELARHLAEGAGQATVPRSLVEVVQAELRRLSPETRELALVCAVLDGVIDPALARAAAGGHDGSFDDLVRAGLLAPEGNDFRMRHDVLREAIRSSLAAGERQRFDAAIAEAAATQGSEMLVAVHGCRAGSAWDPARAHAAAVAACNAVARQYAVESAAAFADLARLVRPGIGLADSEWLGLEYAEGEIYTKAGRDAQARTALRHAAALARSVGDAETLARIALSFGLGHEHGGAHDAEVVALLEDALGKLSDGAHRLRAQLLARLAWQVLAGGQVETRREYSTRAVREARMSEDPGALAAALNAHCWALAAPHDLPVRREAAAEITRAAADAGDVDLQLGGLLWEFRSELEAGNLAGAHRAAAAFDAITTRSPLPYHRWYAYLFRGCLALADGRLDEASAAAAEIDPAATAQEEQARVNAEALAGDIGLARGGAAAIEGTRRMHVAVAEGIGAGWIVSAHLVVLERGVEAGRAELDRTMALAGTVPLDEDELAIHSSLAAAAVLCGAADHARTLYSKLEPYAGHWVVLANGASCRGPVSTFLAILARIAEMPDEAERYDGQARAALSAAGAEGLLHWLELAPLVPQRRSERAGGLTPREAEVLALVARGHSNQEIADALVLSVRTVQRHVENVYNRLGIHNRAGAALAAVNLGLVSPPDIRDPAIG